MKVKQDFVTNSSSTSFVISKSLLTDEQLKEIKDFISMIQEDVENLDGSHNKTLHNIIESHKKYHSTADFEFNYYLEDNKYYIIGEGDQYEAEIFVDKFRQMKIMDIIAFIEN